jgi:ABC-2 type transport system ATP-binding protein
MNAVEVRHLTVRYGSLTAVNSVSFSVPRGEIFGLVGPNGAGKTTTLKVLCGILHPDSGSVVVDGNDMVSEPSTVKPRVGYMADFFGVYDYLTAREYLEFFGGLYGIKAGLEDRIRAMLATVQLEIKANAYVGTLSRGMKQRLYLARALIHDPDLLILDEPASGLDPRGRAELADTLRDVNARGKTIIISSHILSELQDFVTSIGIMETGRLTAIRSVRSPGGAATRHVFLHVAPDDMDRACGLLSATQSVSDVRRSRDGLVLCLPDSDEAVAACVRSLVSGGIRVLLPRADADLKEIFMKLTRGELM